MSIKGVLAINWTIAERLKKKILFQIKQIGQIIFFEGAFDTLFVVQGTLSEKKRNTALDHSNEFRGDTFQTRKRTIHR